VRWTGPVRETKVDVRADPDIRERAGVVVQRVARLRIRVDRDFALIRRLDHEMIRTGAKHAAVQHGGVGVHLLRLRNRRSFGLRELNRDALSRIDIDDAFLRHFAPCVHPRRAEAVRVIGAGLKTRHIKPTFDSGLLCRVAVKPNLRLCIGH
jgi:hypothetical protein